MPLLGHKRVKYVGPGEIERFVPQRSVRAVNGLLPARRAEYRTPSFFKVANYDTVYRDLDAIQAWAPDLVILDEAQRIKNWATRTARSVKKITARARGLGPCPRPDASSAARSRGRLSPNSPAPAASRMRRRETPSQAACGLPSICNMASVPFASSASRRNDLFQPLTLHGV